MVSEIEWSDVKEDPRFVIGDKVCAQTAACVMDDRGVHYLQIVVLLIKLHV